MKNFEVLALGLVLSSQVIANSPLSYRYEGARVKLDQVSSEEIQPVVMMNHKVYQISYPNEASKAIVDAFALALFSSGKMISKPVTLIGYCDPYQEEKVCIVRDIEKP